MLKYNADINIPVVTVLYAVLIVVLYVLNTVLTVVLNMVLTVTDEYNNEQLKCIIIYFDK